MNNKFKLSIITITFSFFTIVANGQYNWNTEQKKIIATMDSLSETTATNGNGADLYGNYLSEDFSRWTFGSSITNNKKKWVEGVREWFDDGWRVSERKQENIEILILRDYAHTRRIVTETYLGPKGDTSMSRAALAELWIKKKDKWLLYRVNVHPMVID